MERETSTGPNPSMGELIRAARTERGLKQRELAERLGVTDKAVSKWENNGSCPDIALLIPLAEVLGLEVTELLQGRRHQSSPDPEEAVRQTLTYSQEAGRRRRRNLRLWLLGLLSGGLLLAAGICLICDFAINHALTWSRIVNLSLLFSWLLLAPPLRDRDRPARRTLTSLTVYILPYLFLLGVLLEEPRVFSIGLPVSLLSLAYLWGSYCACLRLRRRKWLAAAAVLAMTAPLDLGIDLVTRHLRTGPAFWPEYLLPLLLAAGCLLADSLLHRET